MTWQKNTMDTLLNTLINDYPSIRFITGAHCRWSPQDQTITYVSEKSEENMWGILHELGHALLGHTTYKTDAELVQKEMLAWEKANELGKIYGVTLNDEYIQDCLDSYRDWINKRSTCPMCGVKTVSTVDNTYRCFNCQETWVVTPARHHRPYRQIKKLPQS